MRYRDLLHAWEKCGTSDNWNVELDGKVVAILAEPQYEDQFWTSYRVIPMTDDPDLKEQLCSKKFWEREALVFRCCATELIAANAIPTWLVDSNRLNMRALYVSVRPPMPWDLIVLLVRRLLRLITQKP